MTHSTEADRIITQTSVKKNKHYGFNINDVAANKKAYKFKNNKIDTTKYNLFTFFPLALLYQFVRIANCYFLLIVIIQTIPAITPLNAGSAIAPFCTVISVSLIREAVEDYARFRLDTQQNSESTEVYRKRKWVKSRNENLELGELVIIRQEQTFPADILLLDSSSNEGLAYVETATLDGEKALKIKNAHKDTAGLMSNKDNTPIEHFELGGKASCDLPNYELHKLNGSMSIHLKRMNEEERSLRIPFNAKQMLLKGSKLKNTKWIVGFILYTGHNTKLLLNFKRPRMKYSSVEHSLSRFLFIILGLQVLFCITAALCFTPFYTNGIQNNPYLPQLKDLTYRSFLNYFTYMLLLAQMIPISLVITIEFVKMIQAYFIYADVDGYSFVRNYYIHPRTPSLNEMLGCVNIIFSDKTGTLTQNKMHFKYCVVGDHCYKYMNNFTDCEEKMIMDEDKVKLKGNLDCIPFNIGDMYKFSLSKGITELDDQNKKEFAITSEADADCKVIFDTKGMVIEEFWKGLALCHECSIEEDENGIDYTGMSPDDIELVRSARLQGFQMIQSGSTSIRRLSFGGEREKDFEILNLIEFSSDRKRASIIVREDNLIKLYIKGADSVIEDLLSPNTHPNFLKQSKYYVDQFSAQGFRTLFVGMKVLSEQEYQTFLNKFNEANFSLQNKEELLKEAYKLVENNIYLIGSTIVEDKLQDSVPETIRDLRLAGVKVWMLTGDKMNTAYNIGLSCNLINKDLKTFFLKGFEQQTETHDGRERTIQAIINFTKEYSYFAGEYDSVSVPKFAILVDEKALLEILNNPEMTMMFTTIANKAVSVICCRVSPKQKAQVVRMMKEFDRKQVTLSIGDGGNDVPMITEAHIGVGVFGEEGMQAVQSSDYAIGEFKILRRLLLFHGRTSYVRNSEMILYFFYKNFVFAIFHFYFAFFNNFSGQTIIDDWYITLYNKLFTAVPLGVNALFDLDLKQDDGKVVYKMMPFLYQETRDNPIFTKTTFVLNLFRGIIHGILNFFFIIFSVYSTNLSYRGETADIWYISVNLFTNVIMTVSMRLLITTKYISWLNIIVMTIFSWVLYFAFISWVHFSPWFNSHATMGVAFSSPKFYLNLIFAVGTCAIFDYFTKCCDSFINSNIANTLVRLLSHKKKLDSFHDLPNNIKAKLRNYEMYEQRPTEEKPAIEILSSRK